MSFDRVIELFRFQIENVFVQNGEFVYRQTLGVPIGVNNSQDIANLYLYGYESRYIDKLIAGNHEEQAEAFHMSFRLIDDTLSANNDYWKQAVESCQEDGGMYPRALTFNDTTLSENEVRFLGMRFCRSAKGKLAIDVYDKKQDFKFFVQRYPDMRSYIPISIPYGVFTGLLHFRYHICNQPGTFIFRVSQIVLSFIKKGCTMAKLMRLFRNFLAKQAPLRWSSTAGKLLTSLVRKLSTLTSIEEKEKEGKEEAKSEMACTLCTKTLPSQQFLYGLRGCTCHNVKACYDCIYHSLHSISSNCPFCKNEVTHISDRHQEVDNEVNFFHFINVPKLVEQNAEGAL